MLGILGGDERCPIARSLDVLGEKWTLMIVRDALAGSTRFSQFQQNLGIPREVLTARLGSLVEGGVLERTSYKPDGGRAREEYVLTAAGRDLSLVLLALGGWADRHRPSERTSDLRFVDAETGDPVEAAALTQGTHQRVPLERLTAVTERASVA
jgi:DNA-binding HxlR family transcriptional regulator